MASPASLRVLIATFGSLGDLHPYIALAQALKARGHRPVLATLDRYQLAVESRGIAFASLPPTESQLPDMQAVMPLLFDSLRGPEYLVRHMVMPFVREAHAALTRLAAQADVLVTHPLIVAGPLVAEQTGLPWASSVLAPMSLLSACDPPVFTPAPWMNTVRKLGVTPYRALLGLMKLATRHWETPLRELRANLGLPPTRKLALFDGQYSPALNLALFSPLMAEPQPDWPANTQVCGFARYDGAAPDAATQQRLDRFLAAGQGDETLRPIVFALGSSAVMIAGDFWDKAIAAARALNRRAILITAREDRDIDSSLRSGIAEFAYLPYSAVFPHAAINVHQAGIGTLSQALAAGRPQLIVPVSFDQPDNARRTMKLGVARTLAFQKASVEGLIRELRSLLDDEESACRAKTMAITIGSEDGGDRASALIERLALARS
jgi:rhamnosyltransferase subunit B